MSERPNILFLFADDRRCDTVGALGKPAVRTPHLGRLGREGTALTHANIVGGAFWRAFEIADARHAGEGGGG